VGTLSCSGNGCSFVFYRPSSRRSLSASLRLVTDLPVVPFFSTAFILIPEKPYRLPLRVLADHFDCRGRPLSLNIRAAVL